MRRRAAGELPRETGFGPLKKSALVVLGGALLLASCGPLVTLDFGDDGGGGGSGIPTPVVDGPSMETFEASVQPFLESNSCGAPSCHGGSPPEGNYFVFLQPTAEQMGANQARTVCNQRLAQYSPPAGAFLVQYCDASGQANAGHSAIVATDQECTMLYDWVAEGTGFTPPDCPE